MAKIELEEGVKEQIRACSDRKNPKKCFEKILEDNGIPLEQEVDVLFSILKNNAEGEGGAPGGKTAH